MELYIIILITLLSLGFTAFKTTWITKQSDGDDTMKKIANYIAQGAISFLKAEYKSLFIFVLCIAVLLGITAEEETSHWSTALAFVLGAALSALAGFLGMRIATRANVRTAEAAKTSLKKALDISFSGGIVMGINVVALGVLGISVLFIVFLNSEIFGLGNWDIKKVLEVLIGFSLGAESIALFARVGGGIYTKAADVGADLVGKVEAGIPEDDPRNPAVIADNVGDNVGDVAGMGADLFGSYVSTILATMVLGLSVGPMAKDIWGINPAIVLPLIIAAIGIVFSMVASFLVKIKENGNPQTALNVGNFAAVFLTAIASYFAINFFFDQTITINTIDYPSINIFYTVLIGLGVGTLVSLIIEYYTGKGTPPVLFIARQSQTGAATNIIAGLSIGMLSTALPVIVLSIGIILSFYTGGLYGVAMAATGMMATTGIQLAIDAFGPIADNAGGIAEMSHLPKEVRDKTDILDSVGNTTAAIGKGFAIASAALTALAMFSAYMNTTGLVAINLANAQVLGGLLLGGMVPFLFSSLAIKAVGNAANAMVQEVRRQFKEIKGIMNGTAEADYQKCIKISTQAAIKNMLLPGTLAIISPVAIGFILGSEALGGFLSGVLVSGVMMAFFQSNAGGAWDNAKKIFEKGVEINGQLYYKGSEPHKAAIVGDTVGDPFKDTSGPSLNILIKLVSIVAMVIAPLLV
jgi:K(+)-stimulated pyrophosphate-energized sodium pump